MPQHSSLSMRCLNTFLSSPWYHSPLTQFECYSRSLYVRRCLLCSLAVTACICYAHSAERCHHHIANAVTSRAMWCHCMWLRSSAYVSLFIAWHSTAVQSRYIIFFSLFTSLCMQSLLCWTFSRAGAPRLELTYMGCGGWADETKSVD